MHRTKDYPYGLVVIALPLMVGFLWLIVNNGISEQMSAVFSAFGGR